MTRHYEDIETICIMVKFKGSEKIYEMAMNRAHRDAIQKIITSMGLTMIPTPLDGIEFQMREVQP